MNTVYSFAAHALLLAVSLSSIPNTHDSVFRSSSAHRDTCTYASRAIEFEFAIEACTCTLALPAAESKRLSARLRMDRDLS